MTDKQIIEAMSKAYFAIFLDDDRSYVGRHNDAMSAAFVVCAVAIRERDAQSNKVYKGVCEDIFCIMEEYDRQDSNGFVDTPGGFEHMGDVWKQMHEWAIAIRAQEPSK
jgi:hypothetical protein